MMQDATASCAEKTELINARINGSATRHLQAVKLTVMLRSNAEAMTIRAFLVCRSVQTTSTVTNSQNTRST